MRNGAPPETPAPPRGRSWRRRLLALAVVSVVAVPLIGIAAFEAAVHWWPYPAERARPPAAATVVVDADGAALAAFASPDGAWHLPLAADQVSPHLVPALLAAEDARFFEHSGVDGRAVLAAAWQNLWAGRVVRGGSTVTMQVERLRHPQDRTLWAKLEEAVRARQIERGTDKAAIVLEYLNRAPLGGSLVGFEAASRRYFGRPCRDLSLAEAALLAGLPQSPTRFRPDRHPQRARARRDYVLGRMLALGLISPAAHAQAVAEPVVARWHPLPQDRGPGDAPADGAWPTLVRLAKVRPGGVLTTSLRRPVQQQACTLAAPYVRSLARELQIPLQAGVVVMDVAGEQPLALVSLPAERGEPSYVDLTLARRSTGSALKPFIYGAAFDQGWCTPHTPVEDAPSAWAGYAPGNYDRQYMGTLTAAEALAESRNIPAIALLSRVGVARQLGVLDAMGLTGLRPASQYGLTLAIGGAEASPQEMARAYARLAGLAAAALEPNTSRPASPPATALRPEACLQVLRALADAQRTRGVCRDAVRLQPAWKTGTSSGHRDAWCVSATPRRVVAVWLGSARPDGALELAGQASAAGLALAIMAQVDPGGAGWGVEPASPAGPVLARAPVLLPRLSIVSPAAGQSLVLDRDLPPSAQRVRLRCTGGEGRERWWFVNGTLLAVVGEPPWWTPQRGVHRIRVVDAAGTADEVTLVVQ